MRLARGVVLCLAAAVLASAAAATALADAAATDQTATTDVAQSTDGAAAGAATGAADPWSIPESTDPPATSTASDAAGATSTTPDTGTAASTDVAPVIPVAQPIDRGCVLGGVVLLLPHHRPLLIGPVVDAPSAPIAAMTNLIYPADGSVVTASGIALEGTGCTTGQPAGGKTQLHSLSLFGGAITAEHVGLTIGDAGARHHDAISGLEVDGIEMQAEAGKKVPLGSWGYLVTGTVERIRTTAAHGTEPPPLRVQASALAVHLLKRHGALPAGTVLLISFAGLPGPATPETYTPMPVQETSHPVQVTPRPLQVTPLVPKAESSVEKHLVKQQQKKHTKQNTKKNAKQQQQQQQQQQQKQQKHKGPLHHAPWRITPPLGTLRHVFPVTGSSSFVDTYGAFRGDVPGNWHHGDDIFAPLGTPVVAVADGTVNRVGWQRVGGWRIWVVDKDHNRFYYAHLSGYAPEVIHSKTVKAGEVIGFVGNSGDAFTTPPHLHFEIHPKRLRRFGYDGAVDPTRYLQGWSRLQHVHAPRPAHPRLPVTKSARIEARYVFRELLAARGLLKKPTPPPPSPEPAGTVLPPASMAADIVAATPQVTAASPPAEPALPTTTAALVGGSLVMLLALSGSTLAVRRRKGQPTASEAVDANAPAVVVPLPVALVPEPTAPREPHRVAETARTAPRHVPLSLNAGTGSLALVTVSVVLLRRRSARAHQDTDV